MFFFFNDTATTEIYTLSLHDALPIYNSDEEGFDGIVSGPETIQATFDPITARFVKITFENPRTAVDEIEVFMIQRSEEHTSELQSRQYLVCRLLLEKKKKSTPLHTHR